LAGGFFVFRFATTKESSMFRRESLKGMAVQLFIVLAFNMPSVAARAGRQMP